eukprot:scaffold3892_cov255-Pinguiococcus_pyrenoidosus.AAC.8
MRGKRERKHHYAVHKTAQDNASSEGTYRYEGEEPVSSRQRRSDDSKHLRPEKNPSYVTRHRKQREERIIDIKAPRRLQPIASYEPTKVKATSGSSETESEKRS